MIRLWFVRRFQQQGINVLAVYSLLAATVVLYWPTALSLVVMWNTFGSRYYTHGDLILVIAVLLLIRRKNILASVPAAPSWGATAVLLPLSLIWLIAELTNFRLAHQVLFPVILLTAVYATFGREIVRICCFPIIYLYFAIPVWDTLTGPLQSLTVAAIRVLLRLTAVPAFISGNIVQIPAGTFEIQGGCAGLSYFVVALAIATYYGEINSNNFRSRIVLVAFAAGLAVFANWMRVLVIILVGQLTHMQHYLIQVSHDGFGWAVFAVAIAIFLLMAERVTGQAPVDEPAARLPGKLASNAYRPMTVGALSLIFLAMAPAWHAIALHRAAPVISEPVLLTKATGWVGPSSAEGEWQPLFEDAEAQQLGTYSRDGVEIEAFIAAYASQSQNSKLHRSGNSVLGDGKLSVQYEEPTVVAGKPLKEMQLRDAAGQNWLLWVTYGIGERISVSVVRAQLYYAFSRALLHTPQARVIAIRARCEQTCSKAREMGGRFLSDNAWLFAPLHTAAPPDGTE